jgi:uridine nucleosidase
MSSVTSTSAPSAPRKLIIDTDTGVDDAFAIALALETMPTEVDVLGLTTVFGNVRRDDATRNARMLVEMCARGGAWTREDGARLPVVDGARAPLAALDEDDRLGARASTMDDAEVVVADFVHGDDGFGGVRAAYEGVDGAEGECAAAYDAGREAADFIAEMCAKYPGEVTVLALAPLTNVALTFRRHPECLKTMGELVALGGAFEVNGNVNPAAEANILGDPEAADEVFGAFERTFVVGLDVTTRVRLSGAEIERLENISADVDAASSTRSCSRLLRAFLHDATQFYKSYHAKVAAFDGIFVHDPTALLFAVPRIRDAIFTLHRGAVRVALRDCARGAVFLDRRRAWLFTNAWTDRPLVSVAMDVDVDAALRELRARLAV